MPTIKFYLQQPYQATTNGKKKLNDKETRLWLYLILSRKQIAKIKTEHVICPKDWDFRLQKKKLLSGNEPGTPEENKRIRVFNKKLEKLKDDILNEYDRLKEKYPDLPFKQVAANLQEYGKTKEIPFSDKNKTFFEIYDEFLISLEGEVSFRTIQKFKTLKYSLQEFTQANDRYKTLSFSMITKTFLTDYTRHLRSQKPRGRQKTRPEGFQFGLLNDSIAKYIECLKSFLKWCQEVPSEETPYNSFEAYKNFKTSGTKREKKAEDIVTLTLPELRQFYTYDFSKAKDLKPIQRETLERTRDLFCFGAFTGQRWSDIERLDKNEIDGEVWDFISYKTKKATKIYFIGYAAPALDILKKYDFQLPIISLQKFNVHLKKAAEIAEINTPVKVRRYVGVKEIVIEKPKYEFLGSHCGRRTCVSILLNDYNMNIAHVKEITGHADLDTLQKYINSDDEARRNAMAQTKRVDEPLTVVKKEAV